MEDETNDDVAYQIVVLGNWGNVWYQPEEALAPRLPGAAGDVRNGVVKDCREA